MLTDLNPKLRMHLAHRMVVQAWTPMKTETLASQSICAWSARRTLVIMVIRPRVQERECSMECFDLAACSRLVCMVLSTPTRCGRLFVGGITTGGAFGQLG